MIKVTFEQQKLIQSAIYVLPPKTFVDAIRRDELATKMRLHPLAVLSEIAFDHKDKEEAFDLSNSELQLLAEICEQILTAINLEKINIPSAGRAVLLLAKLNQKITAEQAALEEKQ